jgi:hypothetical protein
MIASYMLNDTYTPLPHFVCALVFWKIPSIALNADRRRWLLHFLVFHSSGKAVTVVNWFIEKNMRYTPRMIFRAMAYSFISVNLCT